MDQRINEIWPYLISQPPLSCTPRWSRQDKLPDVRDGAAHTGTIWRSMLACSGAARKYHLARWQSLSTNGSLKQKATNRFTGRKSSLNNGYSVSGEPGAFRVPIGETPPIFFCTHVVEFSARSTQPPTTPRYRSECQCTLVGCLELLHGISKWPDEGHGMTET